MLNGGDGNDILSGGASTFFVEDFGNLVGGDDTLIGGNGIDTASYSENGWFLDFVTPILGVTVNLALTTAQHTGGGGIDTLIGIENLIGSGFDDTLSGSDFANVLTGLGGNDTLIGRLGNDTLNGGAGTDTANYAGSTAGVQVNLATGVATGAVGTDTLIAIETVIASAFNDILTGNSGANLLAGLGGNDILNGAGGNDNLSGAHGADTLIGGLGKDGLLGGNNADRFDFNSMCPSRRNHRL